MSLRAAVLALIVSLGLAGLLAGSAGPAALTPLIFAHRGDTTAAAENTIAAIAAAAAWADGVEFDIRLAPDGTWRLSHDALPPDWEALPTLPDAVAAAGDLLLEIDLKEASDEAHQQLAEWIAAAGIAERVTVNVKSISGARIVTSIVPSVTIEAQPEWVPAAFTAREVDLVLVWGKEWRSVLEFRSPAAVALFVNSTYEPPIDRWADAVASGISRYLADGNPT